MNGKQEIPMIRGDKWRGAYRAQVVGILGGSAPPVSSRGRAFYNKNRWTLRVLTTLVCTWAKQNPNTVLTEAVLSRLVDEANRKREPHPEIVIARTPEQMSVRTAFALIGGADHEALHSLYSLLRDIKVDDVRFILDRWASVPEWNRFVGLLQHWSNVVEDIRIERLGRVEFPGTLQKLHDLQDFILLQEEENEEKAKKKGANTAGSLSIIMRTFRDVGLGYVTPTQERMLDAYRAKNPKAVDLVLNGPLSDLLRESIALGKKDDVACLRIAFDVIRVLYDLSSKVYCPSCGARGSKITIRPLKDSQGKTIPGKGQATCSECGWTGVIDLPEQEKGDGQEGIDDARFEDPNFEDFDKQDDSPSGSGQSQGQDDPSDSDESDDSDDDGDDGDDAGSASDDEGDDEGADDGADDGSPSGKGDASEEDGDDQDGQGGSQDAGDGDDEDAEGEGAGNDDDAENGDDEASQGDSSDEDGEGDEGGAGSDDASEGDQHGQKGDENGGDGAGGGTEPSQDHKGNDWSDLADDALSQSEDNLGMLDSSSALEDAVNDQQDSEDAKDKLKANEARYRPYDLSLDDVLVVPPSRKGKEWDAAMAQNLLQSVKGESSYLRARLRNIVRALEMITTVHGVRKGRDLSERYLVDTKASMLAGKKPERAYWDRDEQIDTSMAAAVVIDESYSMCSMLQAATQMLCAITEPLDALGCAVQVSGFRNGRYPTTSTHISQDERSGCHRIQGVTHDIFKTFDEPFRAVRYRFANTRAEGSTPMSDGIQFALDSLSPRQEGHRVLFVITDGDPDSGHEPVIRHQLRLAKEAGIHVIGVGVGSEARNVKKLYPDHVHDDRVANIPKKLIAKLNELVDAKMASKRGRAIRKTA